MGSIRLRHATLGVALFGLPALSAFGGGYELEAQSPEMLGTANAGKSALADSAATLFWNPAGMSRLARANLSSGFTSLNLGLTFRDAGTTDLTGGQVSGATKEEGVKSALVPAFAFSFPVDDRVSVGMAIQSKYGLITDYGDTWAGRYHATYSELSTLNFNPAVSYRVDDKWSVGAGIAFQYASGLLESKIDFGSNAVKALGPGAAAVAGFSPQGNDGSIEVDGTDWAVGWTAGLLYEHDERTRFGLGVRSRITHTLDGEADFTVPRSAAPLTASGMFTDSDSYTRISTPMSATLSGYHELDDRLALVADVSWSDWSIVEELATTFANPAQPDNSLPAQWHDTFRLSAGAIYKASPRWTLRAGVARAPSPTKNALREVRLPDSDRIWYTLGASFRWSEDTTIDLNVAYVDQDDAEVNLFSPNGGQLRGDVEWDVSWVSIGVRVNF